MKVLSVREEIENAIKEIKINRNHFHEVGKTQWESILRCIEEMFLRKNHHKNNLHWGWVIFKEPTVGLGFLNDDGYRFLDTLIDNDIVWFIAEDHNDKMWVYEGQIKAIISIIANCFSFEYYIVSKKYEWILCENHHGVLIGSGSIVGKMKEFPRRTKASYLEKIRLPWLLRKLATSTNNAFKLRVAVRIKNVNQ